MESKDAPLNKDSERNPVINRRDILRLGKYGLLALASARMTKAVATHELDPHIVVINTPKADFYPIYEEHQNPITGTELKKLPQLDLYLYEFMANSRDLLDSNPKEVINRSTEKTTINLAIGNKREYIVPRDHLDYFQWTRTWIAFEGRDFPRASFLQAMFLPIVEAAGGTAVTGTYALLRYLNPNRTKGSQKLLKTLDLLAMTGFAWSSLSALQVAASKTQVMFGATAEQNVFQRLSSNLNTAISTAHPEDLIVFFRNLLLSRKLAFLGESLSEKLPKKPKIGYGVGPVHSGIEDMLKLRKASLFFLLDTYPKTWYQKIVDENGGINSFCSEVLFSPDLDSPQRRVIVDEELRNFIENKLKTL